MGRMEDAQAAVRATLAIWPSLTITSLIGPGGRPDAHDRLLVEGLQMAGMPVA
jgi:hypothetical protein